MTGLKRRFGLASVVVLSMILLSACESRGPGSMGDVPLASNDKTGETEVLVDNGQKGETLGIGLVSWRDLPFQTVKHQAFDYSCGSAAVATLMTYAYDIPTSEKDVFEEMFAKGDQAKIRREGFSMLDMSNYLNAHGLEAKGYKITETSIDKYKLPFIALINNKGYNHFVVVKTMESNRILVGDPNTGNSDYTKDGFSQIWNGLALIVTNDASKAHAAFNNKQEWHFVRAHAPVRDGEDDSVETASLSPMSWQISPTGGDILPITTVGTVASGIVGGGL